MDRCKLRASLLLYGGVIMKWKATFQDIKSRYYEIHYGPAVGFYLYIFENNRCISDYLQDTLELAIECAWEDFGVPKEAWEKIE